MTSFIAKQVSKKILGESVSNRFGTEDPYFEQVPATRLDGKPSGKFKKVRKALPPGISEHDGHVLTKVKRRAWRLDMSLFNCCGIRFGWSSVIGIVPGVGDVFDAFMAMMVVHTCKQVEGGLPQSVLSKMYMNVILDFLVGLVPFLGDVADAVFRANTRNAVVLEEYLRKKGKKNLRQSGMPIPNLDPSDPNDFDQLDREPMVSSQPGRHGDMSAGKDHGSQSNGVTRPPPAKTGGGSFFGFGRQKGRPADVESGHAR
ncbi:PH domain-containing protein [Pseudomassariella vexata]|uniref:PH domain-containing protein n=1 Tax=Pseudomassariella vexata TaxID=1141098 RepID=A0A1Y2EDA3_9PEZI|nr:PH domain-containing protein [Pseudomassariella vexata]ORY69558.1 PH domain-containing protein [Pseudomassariella vexata]